MSSRFHRIWGLLLGWRNAIADIEITLKIITDQFKQVQLLVSGSPALEINQTTREPLTGRKFEHHQALALQLGSEISCNELSSLLGLDKHTVSKYIGLLEQAFIIFKFTSFSQNQRNEIKNNRKIYFYDNGIRNMIINNLNSFDLRTDNGALWENFLIAERMKMRAYHKVNAHHSFWRTVQKQDIDFVDESNGEVTADEF